MKTEKYRFLAGIIAAHPNRQVVGRTRLQKTVRLLQRLGLPTDYGYTIYFYGPYSEGVQSDIGLLDGLGLVDEQLKEGQGDPYYVITAKQDAVLPEVQKFQPEINALSKANATVLELAATYDAFRTTGDNHEQALERVRRKKGPKCDGGKLEQALTLLQQLGLPTT